MQRGLRVCVLERESPGCGATSAAAGVLARDPETAGFTALAHRSSELWPSFADELRSETGIDPGYTRCGSLVLSFDGTPDETVGGELLEGDECRALEPGIASDC